MNPTHDETTTQNKRRRYLRNRVYFGFPPHLKLTRKNLSNQAGDNVTLKSCTLSVVRQKESGRYDRENGWWQEFVSPTRLKAPTTMELHGVVLRKRVQMAHMSTSDKGNPFKRFWTNPDFLTINSINSWTFCVDTIEGRNYKAKEILIMSRFDVDFI